MEKNKASALSTDNRNEWIKVIGFCVVYLGFIGLLKSYIFFKWFNVNILNYTKWDEYVLVAIQDLFFIIIFFIITSFIPFLYFPTKVIIKESEFPLLKRFAFSLFRCLRICTLLGAIIIIFFQNYYEHLLLRMSKVDAIFEFWKAILTAFSLPFLVYDIICSELLIYIYKQNIGKFFNIYRIFITFCCFILYIEYSHTVIEIISVDKNYYKGSVYKTAQKTYRIDDNLVLLGRTKEYIFLKSKSNQVIIIPVVQIIEETNIKTRSIFF